MAIAPKSSNIRRTYTLSAAALTVAALTLTGCGELTALTTPGAASDVRVAASEAKSAPADAAALDAGTDAKSAPAASLEDPAVEDSDATAPVADESGTAETAAAKADTAAAVTADKAETTTLRPPTGRHRRDHCHPALMSPAPPRLPCRRQGRHHRGCRHCDRR